MHTIRTKYRPTILIALGATGFWLGCSGDSTPPADKRTLTSQESGIAGDVVASAPPSSPVARERPAPSFATPRDQARASSDTSVVPSMIIRNGSASVRVDSLETAIVRVKQIAAQLGGYVANTQMQTGESQVRSATLELKIPAARYDQAVNGLVPLGKVEYVNSTAEDVGEEFVDVTARMNNARRLEERLITLLATRTGKLEDVLAVERELARVREEIERYEGRLRYLKAHAAMSTLTVTVHEKAPIVSAPGENVIGAAFVQAWRNFVRFIASVIASLGWLVPLTALLVAVLLVARRAGLFARLSKPASGAEE